MSPLAHWNQLGHPKVLVIGDLMLDRYIWGEAERVSPEAPVLVLREDLDEVRPGGAANVASFLRGLDAEVILSGVVGDDAEGRTLRRLMTDLSVNVEGVLTDADRVTTSKQRFVGRAAQRQPHQILRVDREARTPLTLELEQRLLEHVLSVLPTCDAVLISDYAKGVCTPSVLRAVIDAASAKRGMRSAEWKTGRGLTDCESCESSPDAPSAGKPVDNSAPICDQLKSPQKAGQGAETRGIPVLIDPARGVDYQRYARATLITPNRVAAQQLFSGEPSGVSPRTDFAAHDQHQSPTANAGRLAGASSGPPLSSAITNSQYPITNHQSSSPSSPLSHCRALRERLNLHAAVITLDRDGLAYATADAAGLVPCRPREVCDVTGAGDMVLSVLGLCLASGIPLVDSLHLANAAAGLEVERFGVEPLSRAEIANELQGLQSPNKIVSLEEAVRHATTYRRSGKTVVLTNGCFDLLHVGHISLLEEAARLGDVLIVAINSDASVRKLKGSERPIIRQDDRARMLAALSCVDHVLIFDDDTPHRLLHAIQPDVLVKGGTTGHIVGREIVEAYGGRVAWTEPVDGLSTTELVQRMRSG